ncbi:hypothetical protein MMC32_005541 [Xylographa parallela]|nr:hypothetical protein [Xylographa parallela]
MSQKLRASCNACNQAKVKCSKSRPTCTRCAKHGEECVYSVSLRAGKRPAHRERSDARSRSSKQSFMNSLDARAKERTPSNRPAVQGITSSSRLQSPIHSPVEARHAWMIEPATAMDLIPMDGDMYLNTVDYEDPSLMNTSVFFDISECSQPSNLQNSAEIESFQENWYHCAEAFDPHVPDPINIPPYAYHERQQSSHTASTSSFDSPIQTPTTPTCSSTCGCFRTILETLSSLYIFSSFPNLTFDVALARNKEAVSLCLAALECNCAAEASFGLLYISLIAKILSIYQSSCGVWSDQSSSSTSARITLGVYNLDREDEERIKMILVRMELRKVETLVAKVREKACQGDGESEIQAFDALVRFLDGKLRAVSNALQIR